MGLTSVTVSGIYQDPSGKLLVSKGLRFTPSLVFGDEDIVVARVPVKAVTDATDASFSIDLLTSDLPDAYVRYTVRLHNGDKKQFDLTNVSTDQALEDLLNAFDAAADPSNAAAIADHEARIQELEDSPSGTPEGSPAVFPVYGGDGVQTDSDLRELTGGKLFWGGEELRLWAENYDNVFGIKSVLTIGDPDVYWQGGTHRPITGSNAMLMIDPAIELTAESTSTTGVYVRVSAKNNVAGYVNNNVQAITGTAYSYGNGSQGGLRLKGITGYAYARSMNEIAAYGGYFEAFTGGNSGTTNSTPLWGMFAKAAGGHNGITPQVRAGEFLLTTIGGGGVGSITDGRGVQITVDGSQSITDFGVITGLSISNWINVGAGRTWSESRGIHIDASIDRGAIKYAIKSDSVSDSVFAGAVKGPINPYDATTWNGSSKFVTEDAARDKFEAIVGASGVGGTGTANRVAVWTSETDIKAVPVFIGDDGWLSAYKADVETDEFKMIFQPATGLGEGGFFDVGAIGSPVNSGQLHIGEDNSWLLSSLVHLGSPYGGLGTHIAIRDSTEAIELGARRIVLLQRAVLPTSDTGNQVLNFPAGVVHLSAGQTNLVVTNDLVDADSIIFLQVQTNDTTAKHFTLTKAAGSFTIRANAAATALTSIGFLVTN